MSFKAVDPNKLGQILADEDKVQVKGDTITLPTRTLYVIDAGEHDLDYVQARCRQSNIKVIGEIEYPLDFCPSDSGQCTQGKDLDGTNGYMRHGGVGTGEDATPEIWYHAGCYRPTRKWFTGHVKRVVKFYGNVPW